MRVEGIFIYPVKSLPGISLREWETEPRGFKFDRKFMLIDSDHKFVSLRSLPNLYKCHLELIEGDILKINYPPYESIGIEISLNNPEVEKEIEVVIWNDTIQAGLMPPSYNQWFSDIFQKDLRLVVMQEHHHRQIDRRYAEEGEMVSFADGYPFLLVQESSLSFLNEKLDKHVQMIRFRPNIIISGGLSFEEDTWTNIEVGNVELKLVKPCGRCKVINIDPMTLELNPKIMETLKSFRLPNFGMNGCLNSKGGNIRIGDTVKVLNKRIN
jgi:uncharacterized protein YcbX